MTIPLRDGLLARVRNIRHGCRQVLGIPDYEAYLAHAAARHPGMPVLSRRDHRALRHARRRLRAR